jgi:hypothetical protein
MIEVYRGDGYHEVNLDKAKVIVDVVSKGGDHVTSTWVAWALLVNLNHKHHSYICQNKIEFIVRTWHKCPH